LTNITYRDQQSAVLPLQDCPCSLEAIKQHIAEHGFPPSHGELAAALGVRSTNAIRKHLDALAGKGAIAIAPRLSRGIRVLGRESV